MRIFAGCMAGAILILQVACRGGPGPLSGLESLDGTAANAKPIEAQEVPGHLSYTANLDDGSTGVVVTCGELGLVHASSCLEPESDPLQQPTNTSSLENSEICVESGSGRPKTEVCVTVSAWMERFRSPRQDLDRFEFLSHGDCVRSPTDEQIACLSTEPKQESVLKVIQLGGSEEHILLSVGCLRADCEEANSPLIADFNDHLPAWSPDGSFIAFEYTRDNAEGIYLIHPDGTGLVRLTQGRHRTPKWSPGGDLIVFVSDVPVPGQGTCHALSLVEVDAAAVNMRAGDSDPRTPLGTVSQLTFACNDHSPTWSPDGRRIAFMSPDGNDGSHVFIINTDGSDLRELVGPEARLPYSDNEDIFWVD